MQMKKDRKKMMKLRIAHAVQAALVVVVIGGGFGTRAQSPAGAAPPASIPTFSTEDIARTGFFYVGGHYAGGAGKEVMDGAEYVEGMVPKKIRRAWPIVFLHGAGQTGTDWVETPDGRAGWAHYFVYQGNAVYMVEYPARGRSAYVPDIDGALTMRATPLLGKIGTDLTELVDCPWART